MNRTVNIIIYSLLLAGAYSGAINAADIENVRPGTLGDAVGADTLTASLKVTGSLDAADFAFIADKMSGLRHLDISECTIAAYSGAALPFSGLRNSPQSQLPPYSFIGMTNLETVILPEKLTDIGAGAFTGSGIRSVSVPKGVISIADYAFMRCPGLESVALPASLERLGERVFANCTSLKDVVFAQDNALTVLPDGTFEGCTSLRELNLDALVQCVEIGPWSLAHCGALTEVIIPQAIRSVGRGALLDDAAVNSLSLNAGVETFDEYSLAGLKRVAKLSLPSSVVFLATGSMTDWSALSEFDASRLTSVPELGDGVWAGIDPSQVRLVVADDLADSFLEAPQWCDFNIMKLSDHTNVTILESDAAGVPFVSVSVHSGLLTVWSENHALGTVAMFNTSGLRMAAIDAGASNKAEIDVTSMPVGAYLIATSAGVAKIVLF